VAESTKRAYAPGGERISQPIMLRHPLPVSKSLVVE
jgi:hypothetical protein